MIPRMENVNAITSTTHRIDRATLRRSAIVILVVLVLLGTALRFTNVGHADYWVNEAATSLVISGFQASDVERLLTDHVTTFGEILDKYQGTAGHRPLSDVIKGVIVTIPPHTPPYYALAYYWAKFLNASQGTLRMLSGVLGMLQLPAVYWFAIELFGSPMIALFCTAMFFISPVQVWYCQEAAEYSLIAAVTCFANAIFLRALKTRSFLFWFIYSLVIALGLWVSINIFWVVVAQLIVTLLHERPKASGETVTLSPNLLLVFGACLIAGLAFVPFALTFVQGFIGLSMAMEFMNVREPLTTLLLGWLDSVVAPILWSPDLDILLTVKMLFLILPLYGIYYCWRRYDALARNILLLNFFVPFLALALPDLIMGGTRSTYTRYQMTGITTLTIIIASCLGHHLRLRRSRLVWMLVTAIAIGACLFCSWTVTNASSHYISPYRGMQNQILDVLRKDKNAVVVTDESPDRMTLYGILCLSHSAPKDARVLWLDHPDVLKLPPDVTHFYLFRPTTPLKMLVESYGYKMTPVLSDWSFLKAEPESE